MDRITWLLTGACVMSGAAPAASLVDLIASMKPSVCAVGTFNALDSPRFGFRGSGFFVGNGSLVLVTRYARGSDLAFDLVWEKQSARLELKWPESSSGPPAIRGELVARR